MNRRLFILFSVVVLLLSSCRTGEFKENVSGNALPVPVNQALLRQAAAATFTQYNFVIEADEPGHMAARKGTTAHNVMLYVEVVYDSDGYQLNYLDDNGYDVNPARGTAHSNYKIWMVRLRDGISENYRNPADASAAIGVAKGGGDDAVAEVSNSSYRHGLEKITWTGFDWFINSRGEVYVTELDTDSPAKGILARNDRILGMQGQPVSSSEQIYLILMDMYPGQRMNVSYSRDGIEAVGFYESGSVEVPNFLESLTEICAVGQSVRLAVLVGGTDEIRTGVRHELQSQEEFLVLEHMEKFGSFRLIDRSRVVQLQNEQQFGLSGLVEESVQVGRMLGASHILDVYLNTEGDTITERLINVQSGEVVSSAVRGYQG